LQEVVDSGDRDTVFIDITGDDVPPARRSTGTPRAIGNATTPKTRTPNLG
jgi:hypothetical protein